MKTITPELQNASNINTATTTLVLGGTGKTGRRIVQALSDLGHQVRIGSRSATPTFSWEDSSNWDEVFSGVNGVYIAYHPDLAVPGASDAIEKLVATARKQSVKKLVLLSGRGEPEAQRCERIVADSGIPYTLLRCAWFNQNFSENFMRDMVLDGAIALPVDGVLEPFVDADDIADVAVAALTKEGHAGKLYELTGPELLCFRDIARLLSEATGRPIQFIPITRQQFIDGMREAQLPQPMIELVDYLVTEVLDGRNAFLTDGVNQALGRKPNSFRDYARQAAQDGFWNS